MSPLIAELSKCGGNFSQHHPFNFYMGITILRELSIKQWLFLILILAGYLLMCLAFNYTISTHDYYHLLVIPIVALSIGSLANLILGELQRVGGAWYWPYGYDIRDERMWLGYAVTVADRFEALRTAVQPDYFIVTDFAEFAAQPELKQFLTSQYPVMTQTDEYIIFALTK